MDRSKEKTTAPYPPVGPDGGQPLSKTTTQSITDEQAEHKPPEEDLTKNEGQIGRVSDPAYLPTLSMNELYEKVFPGKPPVVEGLLYPGVYLFVGAPKVGKSFLMAQLAYHVSQGLPFGGMPSAGGLSSIWPWRTITPACRSAFTGCSERTAPGACSSPSAPTHWAAVWKSSWRVLSGSARTPGLSSSTPCKKSGRPGTKDTVTPATTR